jgi:hypothetical protein
MDGSLVSPDFELIGFVEELGHLESPTDVSDTGAQQAAHAVALDGLLRALRTSDVAMATLHDAAADEIAHAVLRHRGIVESSPATVADTRLRPLDATLARLGQRRR